MPSPTPLSLGGSLSLQPVLYGQHAPVPPARRSSRPPPPIQHTHVISADRKKTNDKWKLRRTEELTLTEEKAVDFITTGRRLRISIYIHFSRTIELILRV
ncbi:hypothetical protein EVAR_62570_1 [Eumeta japonica]|uniref:Uncharacterized protein n=1 Tax=Eumeta variegata TaxID=151549 RepID=A0A4C1YRH9_EUMVA|nr:hypothetical protein EVAR_62570_1 [Eumeta japonica]